MRPDFKLARRPRISALIASRITGLSLTPMIFLTPFLRPQRPDLFFELRDPLPAAPHGTIRATRFDETCDILMRG